MMVFWSRLPGPFEPPSQSDEEAVSIIPILQMKTLMLRGAKSLACSPMANNLSPTLVPLPKSSPSHPTLSQEGEKFRETKKSPEQIYFSLDKFCTEYITVRSSQLSPEG